MRRFAKLTRNGAPCYVDPSLVGIVGRSTGAGRVDIGGRHGELLVDVDEDSAEVYRRLAAAGHVVTKQDVEDAEAELAAALMRAVEAIRAAKWTTASYSAQGMEMAAHEALQPFSVAVSKLKQTVLAALWVAEGEEPPK